MQLQYNRARLYDPTTGRLTTEDPLKLAAGDVNYTRYVGNYVTGATDPSGLFIDDIIEFFVGKPKVNTHGPTGYGSAVQGAMVAQHAAPLVGPHAIPPKTESQKLFEAASGPSSAIRQAVTAIKKDPIGGFIFGFFTPAYEFVNNPLIIVTGPIELAHSLLTDFEGTVNSIKEDIKNNPQKAAGEFVFGIFIGRYIPTPKNKSNGKGNVNSKKSPPKKDLEVQDTVKSTTESTTGVTPSKSDPIHFIRETIEVDPVLEGAYTNQIGASRHPSNFGKIANQIGSKREDHIASMIGGKRSGEQITAKGIGSSDLDVLGPKGELVGVGGPAKSKDLGKFGKQLQILKAVAEERGVPAMMFLEEGTPQAAINLAKKKLGESNVIIFPRMN